MAFTEEDKQGMDNAARGAAIELEAVSPEAVALVAKWYADWYLSAGHKRLGRLLINVAKGK